MPHITKHTSPNERPESVAESATGGGRAWLIWSLSALAFGYAFFQRVGPGVMVSDLMADFAIGATVLGVLSALYFYPYVLLQVPLGALIERWGPRLLMSGALLTAALGSIIFAASNTLWMAYLGRILVGIGCSAGFLGSLALAARWFPPHRFAMLAGMTMFFGMVSGMLGQGPLALFVEAYGWRSSQFSLGVVGAIMALMIILVVRDGPDHAQSKAVPRPWSAVWRELALATRSVAVWKVAFVAAAMSGPMLTLGGLWGTPYLMTAYSLERPQAAFLVSLMLLGWAFGAPFNGWLSDAIGRRKLLLVVGSGVLSLVLVLVCVVPTMPLFVLVALFALAGVSGAAMAVCFALVRETVGEEIRPSALGIVNSLTVASGAVLQPAVGAVLDVYWRGATQDGSRIYEAQTYQAGFWLIAVVAIAGFAVTLTLKESDFGRS